MDGTEPMRDQDGMETAGVLAGARPALAPAPSPSAEATIAEMTERMQGVIDAAERAAAAIRADAEEDARRRLAEAHREADRLTAARVELISKLTDDLTDDLTRLAGSLREGSEQMVRAVEEAVGDVTAKLSRPAVRGLASENGSQRPRVAPAPPPPAYAGGGNPFMGGLPSSQASPSAPMAAEPRPPSPSPNGPERPEWTQATAPAPPDDPSPIIGQTSVSQQAIVHARRLAEAGENRETITDALRNLWGIRDPDPIADRVLGLR